MRLYSRFRSGAHSSGLFCPISTCACAAATWYCTPVIFGEGDSRSQAHYVHQGSATISVSGRTPLHDACKAGCLSDVKSLLRREQDAYVSDSDMWNCMHYAVDGNDLDTVRFLIGVSPRLLNSRDVRGLTPLHVACWNGHPGMVRLLVLEGADIEAKTNWGETPLHYAVTQGRSLAVVKVLVASGADIEAVDKLGRTAKKISLNPKGPQGKSIQATLKRSKEELISEFMKSKCTCSTDGVCKTHESGCALSKQE